MLTGSGPQDRNEEIVPGFPIFALIADHLTRQGIAVLRYDDRGIGESTGSYAEASLFDFASDGKAAVAYLRTRADIDRDQVGVLGHSEGGLYAAMIGADPSARVAFIVSMAGPGVDGAAVLLRQNELILSQAGAPPEAIRLQVESLEAAFPLIAARDWEGVEEQVYEVALDQYAFLSEEDRQAIGLDAETFARANAAAFRETSEGAWFPTFLEYDPSLDWARTTVPVLALFGALDLQVDAEQNAAPLVQSLVRPEPRLRPGGAAGREPPLSGRLDRQPCRVRGASADLHSRVPAGSKRLAAQAHRDACNRSRSSNCTAEYRGRWNSLIVGSDLNNPLPPSRSWRRSAELRFWLTKSC